MTNEMSRDEQIRAEAAKAVLGVIRPTLRDTEDGSSEVHPNCPAAWQLRATERYIRYGFSDPEKDEA